MTRKNLVPLPYRRVSVQRLAIPLTVEGIRQGLLGREAYRRTDFVVLRDDDATAVVQIQKADAEALFSPIVDVTVLSLPATTVWLHDPTLDTGNPSALAERAVALGLSTEATLVVEGLYGHVNFIHRPAPLRVRVVEVAPPEPPKLLAEARRALAYEELPPLLLEPAIIDLNARAATRPAAATLFPCRASGLAGPGETYYLDERPPRQDWVLVGCERSRQFHRHFYGDEPPVVEMCPRQLAATVEGPTLTKCCLLETEIAVEGQRVVVPWGANLRQVAAGLRALIEQVNTTE